MREGSAPRAGTALRGNFVLTRMVQGKGKRRTNQMVRLDEDLLAIAREHGISPEHKNLSDDINMAWYRSLKERGYVG